MEKRNREKETRGEVSKGEREKRRANGRSTERAIDRSTILGAAAT
jgi:hypothetical protein